MVSMSYGVIGVVAGVAALAAVGLWLATRRRSRRDGDSYPFF